MLQPVDGMKSVFTSELLGLYYVSVGGVVSLSVDMGTRLIMYLLSYLANR